MFNLLPINLIFVLFPLLSGLQDLQQPCLTSPNSCLINVTKSQPKRVNAFLTGSEGQYTAIVAVTGDIDNIWEVLTDYDNFDQYLPNVTESTVLESDGNQQVYRQVQSFPILFFASKGTVKISVTETYPTKIEFTAIEGDVKHLKGTWTIRPMTDEQYLITHTVSVEPDLDSSNLRTVFFNIYEDSLQQTLEAIKVEVEKRSGIE